MNPTVMELKSKTEALVIIDKYANALKNIAKYLDLSDESLPNWSKLLGLSASAISNKKAGRREWKPNEVRMVLEKLKKDVKIVDDYLFLIDSIDKMIYVRGFKKQFIYGVAGLTNMQIQVRNQSKKKNYSSWDVNEIRKIVTAL